MVGHRDDKKPDTYDSPGSRQRKPGVTTSTPTKDENVFNQPQNRNT